LWSSNDKIAGLRIKDGTVEVFRTIVLIVLGVRVASSRFRFGIVEVLLIERPDTIGTLLRVLIGIFVRERSDTH
jgi:hypothetical protein